MKRRVLFGLTAMLLAVSMLLTACGSNPAASQNNGGASSAKSGSGTQTKGNAGTGKTGNAAGSTASKLKPYKLTLYVPGAATPKDEDLVNQAISKYLKTKINATFELHVIPWGSWQDKMNLKLASGEQFDMMYTANWDGYATKIQQGSIIPLNKLMDKYAKEAEKVINPLLIEGGKIDGKNYGMPTNKELGSEYGLMLRKDLVDKYHIDISKIKTLQDMEPIYKMIKQKEPGVVPLYLNKATSVYEILHAKDFVPIGAGPGGLVRGATDFKVVNEYKTKQYKAALDLGRKWYLAGYVNKDAATLGNLQSGLKAGKAFSYVEQLKPGKDTEVSNAMGVKWVQVAFTKPIVTTDDTLGAMISISRTSKDPARAMMFLNLLYTDKKLVNMLVYGIEGKHYVKVGPNTIDFPPGVTAATSGYNLGEPYLFGNQFNDYLWKDEDPHKWDKFRAFNAKAEKSPALGFTFDVGPVKNEIAAIHNAAKEYNPGLLTGTLDPAKYLPKELAKFNEIGADKIIAEKQKQLNAWLKTKK